MLKKIVFGLICVGLTVSMSACTKTDASKLPQVSSTAYGTVPEISFLRTEEPLVSSVQVLDEGDGSGAVVGLGDLVVVDYYGKTWDGSQIPDSTITDAAGPRAIALSDPPVPGWQKLEGLQVGQRVLLVMAANDAYGKLGSKSMGVQPDQAIAYVVDIVKTFSPQQSEELSAAPVNAEMPNGIKVVSTPEGGYALDATAAGSYPTTVQSALYASGVSEQKVGSDETAVVRSVRVEWGQSVSVEDWTGEALSALPAETTGLVGLPLGSVVLVLYPASPSNGPQASLVQIVGSFGVDS